MTEPRVIALGFFDGVHLGHGQLLDAARNRARAVGAKAACVTFDCHPSALLTGQSVPLLTTPEDRERVMVERYGIDRVLTLHFDRAMMDMPWEDFLHRILLEQYGAVGLVCGHDFRFGSRGLGTAEKLKAECDRLGIFCQVIPPYTLDGITVSSTYIRSLILTGDMEAAARFLGYPYCLHGKVVSGARIGRTMGTPTANLQVSGVLLPPKGVYACLARTPFGTYPAVANIGTRPTVAGENLTIEPWLLDFSGDLYGTEMTLKVHKFLRGERKFPSLEALQAEIKRNGEQTREYFAEKGILNP